MDRFRIGPHLATSAHGLCHALGDGPDRGRPRDDWPMRPARPGRIDIDSTKYNGSGRRAAYFVNSGQPGPKTHRKTGHGKQSQQALGGTHGQHAARSTPSGLGDVLRTTLGDHVLREGIRYNSVQDRARGTLANKRRKSRSQSGWVSCLVFLSQAHRRWPDFGISCGGQFTDRLRAPHICWFVGSS